MNLLLLSDLQKIDYLSWRNFLKTNRDSFSVVILLGNIDNLLLRDIRNNFKEKKVLGVYGNYDCSGDLEYFNIKNIHGKSIKLKEKVVSGVEGALPYEKGNDLLHRNRDIFQTMRNIKKDTDIIVSHNSPLGIHDDRSKVIYKGYAALKDFIAKYQPKYCIHGHQLKDIITVYKKTRVIGVYGGTLLNTRTGKAKKVLKVY